LCPPPSYTFVAFDFNQIELRVACALSGDSDLAALFNANVDVLRHIAQRTFGIGSVDDVTSADRQAVKTVVYGIMYGMSEDAGAEVQRAATYLRAAFPALFQFIRRIGIEAVQSGTVHTLLGRRGIAEADPRKRRRLAVAYAVQSSAAEVLKLALMQVHSYRQSTPELQTALSITSVVHDEIILSAPVAEPLLSTIINAVTERLRSIASTLSLPVALPVTIRTGSSLGSWVERVV